MKFTTKKISDLVKEGKLPEQSSKTRKELFREKLMEDPDMIKRGYERGYIVFGDRAVFVRSRWEANMCAYYEFLKQNRSILDWEYEPTTFWFEGIKRGTNNYKPDFKITESETSSYYVEVKGYWEKKDSVKQARMAKYHPNIVMRYIKQEQYMNIARNCMLYPEWGQPFKKREEVEHLIKPKQKPVKEAKRKVSKIVL